MVRTFLKSLILALLFSSPLLAADVAAPEVGDDGLHKAPWMRETFKDLREDLAEADAEGKRLMVMVEQRGCIYCRKMHEEVFVVPEIDRMLDERFFVVQINMFGDVEVTDFDGTTLPEKEMVQRWGIIFTPQIMFFPETAAEVPQDATAPEAQVAYITGAFGRWTTQNMMSWVLEKGYETEIPFQKYHAEKFATQQTSE